MRRIATNLVDAKYGRLSLEEDKCPLSAMTGATSVVDEPVFILRAQDDLAVAIITRYRNMAGQIEDPSLRPSDDWFAGVDAVIADFMAFRNENADKVKVPD